MEKLHKEIQRKIHKANNVTYQQAPMLKRPNISIDTKRKQKKLFQIILTPILC